MGRLVAGVDCSTQATKVLIVDPDTGRILATGRATHGVSGERGARETDPRDWWVALSSALAQTGLAADVGAIAVGGQQHGLVTLDAGGEPIRPALLWNDTRSAAKARELVDALGADVWAQVIGSRPVASFTVTKWAYLRETEPDSVRRTAAIRLPHDFVTQKLTGRGVTDRGDASGTGWWSTATGRYAPEILDLPAVGLDPALLPDVCGPREPVGEVLPAVAEELGLPAGVVVGPGTGDNMGAALGLGTGLGQPVVSLGTSGTAFAVSERRPADPSGIVAGFADATGRFLPLACTLNCTLAVDRIAEWFRLDRDDVEPSGEVVILPYFDGERTPDLPAAPALMTGLRHATRPQQILMAAYEGAAASLLEALDAIGDETGGLDPDVPLVLVGGGARGARWREVVRRLSGRPVLIPEQEEFVALGAAVQATAVWHGEEPAAIAARWKTSAGTLLDPLPRDDERLSRIGRIRSAFAAASALSGSRG